jgi:hypothetical protein
MHRPAAKKAFDPMHNAIYSEFTGKHCGGFRRNDVQAVCRISFVEPGINCRPQNE